MTNTRYQIFWELPTTLGTKTYHGCAPRKAFAVDKLLDEDDSLYSLDGRSTKFQNTVTIMVLILVHAQSQFYFNDQRNSSEP